MQSGSPEQRQSTTDIINRPEHYHKGGIDVIGFMRDRCTREQMAGFFLINAVKYLTRYQHKGTPLDDLRKARFYIDRLIEQEEEACESPTKDETSPSK